MMSLWGVSGSALVADSAGMVGLNIADCLVAGHLLPDQSNQGTRSVQSVLG